MSRTRRKYGGDDGYSGDAGFHRDIKNEKGYFLQTEKTGKANAIHLTPKQKRNQGIYNLARKDHTLFGKDSNHVGKIFDKRKEAVTRKSLKARAARLAIMKRKTRVGGKRRAKKRRTKKRRKRRTKRRRKRKRK
jgi:hypothetical protein